MSLPKHIAIIMDGNGRWAGLRNRPRTFGHIKGARVAKKIITACVERKIQNLTLYTFSSENWLRPSTEVSFLMSLLTRYLKKEIKNLMEQNIKFQVIGEISKLSPEVRSVVDRVVSTTANNTGMTLTFAISYGSRQEIAEAAKRLAQDVQDGVLSVNDIDESSLNSRLMTYPIPDPDLIIRTSGEQRLSNFLLWQAAYSEFYFSPTLWPDFSEEDLDLAVDSFLSRERRFGAVTNNEISHN